jgi:hypothetical protein
MTAVERVAAFLKDRDDYVKNGDCDDVERMESAKEIIRALFDDEGKINFNELLVDDDREITLEMTPAKRPAGVCRACGATVTEKGKPLTGRYCSRTCIEAGPSRPTVDIKAMLT